MRIAAWTAVLVGRGDRMDVAVVERPAGPAGFADDRHGLAAASLSGVRQGFGSDPPPRRSACRSRRRGPAGHRSNILLIDSGDAQLGFVTTGTALSSVERQRRVDPRQKMRFDARAVSDVRTHSTASFWRRKSSRIGSLRRHGRQAVRRRPPGRYCRNVLHTKIFDTLELLPPAGRFGAWNTLSAQLHSGRLDALVGGAGTCSLSLPNWDRTGKSASVPLSVVKIAKLAQGDAQLSDRWCLRRFLSLAERSTIRRSFLYNLAGHAEPPGSTWSMRS